MELHKNKEVFQRLVSEIDAETGLLAAIIEKDYYVTLFLKSLSQRLPAMIFKGGTSLSKCYHVIKRFSEDIDVTVDYIEPLTQGQYKKIKQAVVDSAAELGFTILNLEDTRSRRDFNQYKIEYPAMFTIDGIKQFLFVEISVAVRSFPTESRPIKSIVQEVIEERGQSAFARQYDLHEFSIRTQSIDRTFIDKLFALGDYYISGKEAGHSRHLYDIYKLLPLVKINDSLKTLVNEVREVRARNQYCRSAQDGVDMQRLLKEIADKDVYKKDYEETLSVLLYEPVGYGDAKRALLGVIEKKLF